ncbi:MAG: hypothetical protein KatS3mg059_1213 [Thermomicrobiales bacterium]|nr:MAG: hypothetical protein KatS3mg059_1213 [Thermomicrobiales bacterium]
MSEFATADAERSFTAEFPFTAIAPHWGAEGDPNSDR